MGNCITCTIDCYSDCKDSINKTGKYSEETQINVNISLPHIKGLDLSKIINKHEQEKSINI